MNQIKAGAILNYIIIALNAILGLCYTPYMLRMLGQNEYGLYSLVASIIAYLTLLDFGFGNAIVRYTAKFIAENNHIKQWNMFGMFLIIYSTIGLVALIGGMGMYFNVDLLFDKTMSPEDLSQAQTMMILLTINLAFTFPLSIFSAIITAYENFVFQRIVNIIRIILTTLVMVLLLYVGYKAIALVVVQTIFNLLTLVINYIYCKRKLRVKIYFKKFDWSFIKEISGYSFWIFLNAIVEKIYWGTGQFILGATIGTVAVAIFSIGILLQQMFSQFSSAIASVLLPKITTMVSLRNDDNELSQIFLSTGRLQSLVLTIILSGFIIFGHQFILIWAGDDYSPTFIIALIFYISLYTPLIQNTGVSILQARNKLKFRALSYVLISVLSVISQIMFSKSWGAIGCAIAVGGCLFFGQGIIMNVYYQKVQNIDIIVFWKSILKMNICPLILTIAGYYAVGNILINSYSMLFLAIAIYLIVYLPMIFRFSMNDYEKSLIIQPINKLLSRNS